ncbi:MAG TPA: hypothetical protein VFL31_01595 [Nitrospiraceae bacterium]|nr:hypothetical protein [Nitrospiraceae bacterium]
MAKAVKDKLLPGLSGKLEGIIIRRMREGSIRLGAKPDFSERQFSEGQLAHQQRFREASAYARRAVRIEPAYAELARRTNRNAYNIALSDWFHPPVIYSIERVGGLIRVEAGDNVLVAKVELKILDVQGQILEQGYAIQRDPELCHEWWEYTAETGGTILVEAWDLAGNKTQSVL